MTKANSEASPMPDVVAVTVLRGRSVQTEDGTQGPGSSIAMASDEAALLSARGFVTLAGQEPVEPRTIRVEDASPDRIGLQTGASPSCEEQLAASRRGAP